MRRCIVMSIVFVVLKQKTAYEMRISDWSSDVCASVLQPDVSRPALAVSELWAAYRQHERLRGASRLDVLLAIHVVGVLGLTDRKSVVSGTSVTVRVDLGGRRSIINKSKQHTTTYLVDIHKE